MTCLKHRKTVSIKRRYLKYGDIVSELSCGCRVREPKIRQIPKKEPLKIEPPKEKPFKESFRKKFSLYPYQKDGVRFLERSGGRALILDEMGLGKTVQALVYALRSDAFPLLILCKAPLMTNWYRECIEWLGFNHLPLICGSGKIDPVHDVFICSLDMIHKKKNELSLVGIELMIIDEVQNIKSEEAKRTKAVHTFAKLGNGKGGAVEKIIGMTGTPIKNRASEFYPTLNMIREDLFPTKHSFYINWVRTYVHDKKEREGGLRNIQEFIIYTKEFIIRRKRDEVLPDLPKVDRQNRYVDMSEMEKAAYAKVHRDLENFMNKKKELGFKDYSTILQFISMMRQITALSKSGFAAEYIQDFLDSSDTKITVFTHHHLAIDVLCNKLGDIPYLRFRGKQDKDNIDIFNKKGGPRVLLASTQAAGEGLNLQYQCHHCLFMERQWNPAIEEQAEGRFTRIGSTHDKVTATYLIAIRTIDEWMTELIEKKRVSADVDNERSYNDISTVNELAQLLIKKGLPKWRLPKI